MLFSFIGSIAVSYNQASTDHVSYVSRLPLAAAYSTNVMFDRTRSEYDLEALYYRGGQKTKATQTAAEIIQLLGKLKYAAKEVPLKNNNEYKWELQDAQQKAVGRISISYSPSFMEYETMLVIFGGR